MTGEETTALERMDMKDRGLVVKFAAAKAELDEASRTEERAERDLERARERRIKAQVSFKKASEDLRVLLPKEST